MKTYRAIATRTGVLVLSPATYHKSWGVQKMDGPHMRIDDPTPSGDYGSEYDPVYGCALDQFLADYEDVREGVYRKRTSVTAKQHPGPTVKIKTLEGPVDLHKGGWLVQDERGNQWPVSDATFRATYELVE